MALVRGPWGTSQVKGSVGSKTFQQTASGLIVRERTVPVNPNTGPQNAVRAAMGSLSTRWTSTLTAAQRDGWNQYAQLTPLPNRFGDLVNVGGRQMFIRANQIRQTAGLTVVDDAPPTPGVADEIAFDLTGDTTDGIEIANPSVTLAAGDLGFVGLSPAVNQSKNYFSAPFIGVAVVSSATTFPLEIKPAAEVSIGQRYFVRTKLFLNDGKTGAAWQNHVDVIA